jgi:hypothetical protein
MNCPLPFSALLRPCAIAVICFCAGARAFADVITDWNAVFVSAMRNPNPGPGVQARTAAIMHGAMFDAVNGIARKYAPLRVTEAPPPAAWPEAAAAQAAYTTLVALVPAKQAAFDTQLATSLAQIAGANANSASIAAGRTWGENVARQILAWRANDGFTSTPTYTISSAPGFWRHAPLENAPAIGTNTTVTLPFALANPAAFDPGPPYGQADRMAALSTAAYTADFNEVKARGGAVSSVRTPVQRDLALFIATADPADFNAAMHRVLPANARLVDNARTFALLNMASHDAGIVCFQSKYKYGFWRPLQAIVYADLDGNPATVADPAWVPMAATPSHPEYLSGHAVGGTALAAVMAAVLGDDTPFTITTTNSGAPLTASFASFSAYADASVEARINIGFHFRTACRLGQAVGYAVANEIMRTALLPQPGSGMINVSVRGRAGTGTETLIAGFVVGAGSRQVLVRGIGPGLSAYGVAGALGDPKIALYDSAGRLIADNDNWASGGTASTAALTAAAGRIGAFPLGATSLDAALVATLSPGSYTVHLTGPANASGVAMIEVHELP